MLMQTNKDGQAKDKQKMTGQARSSFQEFLEFVFPPAAKVDGPCPTWPPDVFAVAATIMRRTGTYVRSIPAGNAAPAEAETLLGRDWPAKARRVGRQWRSAIDGSLSVRTSATRVPDVIDHVAVPTEVDDAWKALLRRARETSIERCAADDDLCRSLLQLNGYADEASAGLGLPTYDSTEGYFYTAAKFFLETKGKVTFCHLVDPSKARVLGKKHTPQHGLTLRSMTHHLSLCMPWEVEAQWYDFDAPRVSDVLNLLLLPWPLEVNARDFSCVETDDNHAWRESRTFRYKPIRTDKIPLAKRLETIWEQAQTKVGIIHGLILPELALTRSEWEVAQKFADSKQVLLVSGISDDIVQDSDLLANSCRTHLGSLASPIASYDDVPVHRQDKHHRWCLDRSQVLQYELGGQLPSTLRCWEDSHISKRGIFFATLGGWLTFSVLICEDLARQDPIAEVLRSVAPNLVIALLMDGPQLSSRWSARYASVLADDPGTSVLTLTSLGMCLRSRPAIGSREAPSRVVALWKDKIYGSKEIALEPMSQACVLSLARKRLEEFTADGRSDGKCTEVPVFSGVFQI